MKEIATVKSDGLKLRASVPNGKVLDDLAKGDEMVVIGRVKTKTVTWLHVVVGDGPDAMIGYVASEFVWTRVVADPLPKPADFKQSESAVHVPCPAHRVSGHALLAAASALIAVAALAALVLAALVFK